MAQNRNSRITGSAIEDYLQVDKLGIRHFEYTRSILRKYVKSVNCLIISKSICPIVLSSSTDKCNSHIGILAKLNKDSTLIWYIQINLIRLVELI